MKLALKSTFLLFLVAIIVIDGYWTIQHNDQSNTRISEARS
ncbi:hypothetical protein [Lacticaseibacillus manihotivorans]|jgi:hypothetical protein|nr:hypothetical protein [Lacticaseibacillus manihotivorans]